MGKWERLRQHVIRYLGKGLMVDRQRVMSSSTPASEVRRHLDVEIIDKLASDLGIRGFRLGRQ